MNSTLQIIIVILFILFLLSKIYPLKKDKLNNNSNNKSISESSKDKFWNVNEYNTKMTKEECNILFNQDEEAKKNISDLQTKCCSYTTAIENVKTNIIKTTNKLKKLLENKDNVVENIQKKQNCSKKESELINCINEKIREYNVKYREELLKDDTLDKNFNLNEINATDFYQNFKDYTDNIREKYKDIDNIEEKNKKIFAHGVVLSESINSCLNQYSYLKNETNKEECGELYNTPLMDEFTINKEITNSQNFKENQEKKLKEYQCGECHQCADEPETNCVDRCSGVQPINGSYNVLFLTETQQPPPNVLNERPETQYRNSLVNQKNLEERLAKEEASRKAMNTEIYGERPPVSREEQVEKNQEFKQELKKQLEQDISNSLLTAKQTSDQTPFALIENTPNINTSGENSAESDVLSYDSGDTHPNMKVNGKKLSHTYQVNQNQLKVNQILGYDVDEMDNKSLLKQSDKSGSNLKHSSTNLGYQAINYGNFPNDHQYNNIADLEGSLQNSSNRTLNSSSRESTSRTSGAPNIHHHYHHNKQQQNPKIYYKTSKDSKLIPMITQENIDGISNVFAPYIHLEIPPHFVPNQDI